MICEFSEEGADPDDRADPDGPTRRFEDPRSCTTSVGGGDTLMLGASPLTHQDLKM